MFDHLIVHGPPGRPRLRPGHVPVPLRNLGEPMKALDDRVECPDTVPDRGVDDIAQSTRPDLVGVKLDVAGVRCSEGGR
jgi:hypothetical protein